MPETIENLKDKVEYIQKEQADGLREKYIEHFIDVKKAHYQKYIATVKEYSDGFCYTGYLWDCLKTPIFASFEELIRYRDKLNKIIIFWDIHSKEKIFIPDYWKFGKNSVLRLNFNDFLDHMDLFPEDVYIFDSSMDWTFIFTHEDNNGVRICFKVGNI